MSSSAHYKPLAQNSRSIRLIEILPGKTNTISCTFHHVDNLDHCPQYIALSYTWGPETPKRKIIIDGTPFKVRKNLWLALRALRTRRMGQSISKHLDTRGRVEDDTWKLFYVDAICINQDDGLEKSHQVNLMGPIFSEAKTVVSWLGERRDDSDFAFKLLKGYWKGNRRLDHSDNPSKEHPMRGFFNRPYWGRLWIIQEIMLAKEVAILCGNDICSWADAVEYEHQSLPYKAEKLHQKHLGVVKSLDSARMSLNGMCDLSELMWAFSAQSCEIPHDKVFGLLGLVPSEVEKSGGLLSADYSKSPAEVWRAAVDYLRDYDQITSVWRKINTLHLLAHQMDVKPPQSLRTMAALYLKQDFVSNAQMDDLYRLALSPEEYDKNMRAFLWDATSADPEQELEDAIAKCAIIPFSSFRKIRRTSKRHCFSR